ncbi:MAG: DUF927 domain-containing protein [Sphingomonadaceae bacterium]
MPEAKEAMDFADATDDNVIRASIASAGKSAKFPYGYSIKNGLLMFAGGDDDPVIVSAAIDVLAQTRDDLSASWGLLLGWKDSDKHEHRWAMPMSLLAGEGNEIRATLLDRGCFLGQSKKAKDKLIDFLAAVKIETRARAVERVGWTEEAFALPDRTIGENSGRYVIYQGPAAFDHQYRSSGDLKDWQDAVAKYGVGNSRIAVSISAAFVGPLLDLIGEEGGGLNLRGPSSIGKSTALFAAASVWGPHGFVRQWRATSNGLEGVAVQHNETLLCLDELGQLDPKEAGSVAYMLANGMGKARAARSGALKSPAHWRIMFLSSGEIGLADLAKQDGRGRRSAAGQQVRILDVEADAGAGLGLFEALHGLTSAELLARTIKDGAATYYGTAGPAFVEQICKHRDTIAPRLRQAIDGFVSDHLPPGADGQVSRACRRFGLIAAAGEMAARLGVLPWDAGEATGAAATLLTRWIDGRGGAGAAEDREAVAKVRAFLEAHGSARFEPMECSTEYEPRIINRAGFWQSVDGLREYLILPEVWRTEVCAGVDATRVARVLAGKGMLRTDAAGKYSLSRNLPGMGKSRVYVVTAEIFGGDDV